MGTAAFILFKQHGGKTSTQGIYHHFDGHLDSLGSEAVIPFCRELRGREYSADDDHLAMCMSHIRTMHGWSSEREDENIDKEVDCFYSTLAKEDVEYVYLVDLEKGTCKVFYNPIRDGEEWSGEPVASLAKSSKKWRELSYAV